MCLLFLLPSELLLLIVGEWCASKDFSILDRALCNRYFRSEFFALLQSTPTALKNMEFRFRKFISSEHIYTRNKLLKFYRWYSLRMVHINALKIHVINSDYADLLNMHEMKYLMSIKLNSSINIKLGLIDMMCAFPKLSTIELHSSYITLQPSTSPTPSTMALQSLKLLGTTVDTTNNNTFLFDELSQILPRLKSFCVGSLPLSMVDMMQLIDRYAHRLETFAVESTQFMIPSEWNLSRNNEQKPPACLQQLRIQMLPSTAGSAPFFVSHPTTRFLQLCERVFQVPITIRHLTIDANYDEWDQQEKEAKWERNCLKPPRGSSEIPFTDVHVLALSATRTPLDPSHWLFTLSPPHFAQLSSLYLNASVCPGESSCELFLASGCLYNLSSFYLEEDMYEMIGFFPWIYTIAEALKVASRVNHRLQKLTLLGYYTIASYWMIYTFLKSFPAIDSISLEFHSIKHTEAIFTLITQYNRDKLRHIYFSHMCYTHKTYRIATPGYNSPQSFESTPGRHNVIQFPQLRSFRGNVYNFGYKDTIAFLAGAPRLWSYTNAVPDMTKDCSYTDIIELKALFKRRNIEFHDSTEWGRFSNHGLVWYCGPTQM